MPTSLYGDPNLQSGLPGEARSYYLNFGDPTAGFWKFLQERGLLGNTPLDRYAQNKRDDYYGQYQATIADEPGLGFYDFLQRQNPQGDFTDLSASQRGFASNIYAPRGRWVIPGR